MSRHSTGSAVRRKPDLKQLKSELARIERESKKLSEWRSVVEATIVAKATVAEEQGPMAKTSAKPKKKRPKKKFPLNIHKGTGYWCKKVNGKVFYFGRVADDPKGVAALEQWLREKDELYAGREPRDKLEGEATIELLCSKFLEHQEGRLKTKEIGLRTWQGYIDTCKNIEAGFGRQRTVANLTPEDFRKFRAKLAGTRKLQALKNEILRVRGVFKYGLKAKVISQPADYGMSFEIPPANAIERERNEHRNEHGDRMFEADEVRMLLDHLDGKTVVSARIDKKTKKPIKVPGRRNRSLRAMVLLAANCAFGQTDLSSVPTRAVDLEKGWVDFPRPKTGEPRRIPLWPETILAIGEWLKVRPKAKSAADSNLLFLTREGARLVKLHESGYHTDLIGQKFAKRLRLLGIKRPRLSIYGLRHGFETIAGETADQVAVDAVMGHKAPGMARLYRERIGDDRLSRVVNRVRDWLFPPTVRLGVQKSDPCDPTVPTPENAGQAGSNPGRDESANGSHRSPPGRKGRSGRK